METDGKVVMSEISRIINENCTWIRAVDCTMYRVIYLDLGFGMVPYPCLNLVLKSFRFSPDYRVGHEWYIPDFRLIESAERIAGKKRAADLTRDDVERIVMDASRQKIRLNLREFVL